MAFDLQLDPYRHPPGESERPLGRMWSNFEKVTGANSPRLCLPQLACGFVKTFDQFLAVRALFGIGMGGIWGQATATALEALPTEVRGLFSGILQQGYAIGYLFAAIANLYLVPASYNTQAWRPIFWSEFTR